MSRSRTVPLALLAAVCALCALAPAAGARLVVQRSIAGIELGQTRAEVVDRKGKPDGERIVPHAILGQTRVLRYGATKAFFGGTKADAGVSTLVTTSPRQRTVRNVGVGVRERIVSKRVAHVRCETEYRVRTCSRGRFLPGRRVTTFFISSETGRVTSVTVGIVVD